ncbi:MAG: Ig-like domain-containing protein [Clostridia bacterium]|nr:Ig-like domain-containing protein [Clostridia bacterium]
MTHRWMRTLAALLALTLLLGCALSEEIAPQEASPQEASPQEAALDAPVAEAAEFELGEPTPEAELTVSDEEGPMEVVEGEAMDPEGLSRLPSLDPVTLAVGQTTTLNTGVSGTQYKSSSTKIATVGLKTGVVKGVKAGTCTIAARVPGYGDYTCTVTVKKAPTKVTLSPTKLTMGIGDTEQLKGTLSPSGCLTALTFTTSSKSVATVTSDGLIKAVGNGKATITVKTHNGKSAKCAVTVYTAPTGITLNKTEAALAVKGTLTLTPAIKPAGATATVTFKSSNTKVATVTSKGKVTAKAGGACTITATTQNGLTASCDLTVTTPPTGVKLDKTSATLEVDDTLELTAAIQPAGVTGELFWSSSNAKVASVNANGVVTGVKAGTATITVKTANNKKATCKVKVTAPVVKLTVKLAKDTLKVGETTTATTNYSSVKWAVEGTAVKVSSTGKVTALKAGEATIWAQASNGAMGGQMIVVEEAEPDADWDAVKANGGGYIIDISKYQGTIDFDKMKPYVTLVIARATLSTSEDVNFASYAKAMNSRGIPFGVYCYSKASTAKQAQAEALALVQTASPYKPKFYVLDAEYTSLSQQTIVAFAEALRTLGVSKVGCYIAHNKYKTWGYDSIRGLFDFTWIPRYGKNDGTLKNSTVPAYACDLWQYTSEGTVPGISGGVDMNVITTQGRSLSYFTK